MSAERNSLRKTSKSIRKTVSNKSRKRIRKVIRITRMNTFRSPFLGDLKIRHFSGQILRVFFTGQNLHTKKDFTAKTLSQVFGLGLEIFAADGKAGTSNFPEMMCRDRCLNSHSTRKATSSAKKQVPHPAPAESSSKKLRKGIGPGSSGGSSSSVRGFPHPL